MAVTIATRFYDFLEIPMTYDEFSALFRTRYNSFIELIEKGVKIDAHPAGIQVFEYFWVKLFGENIPMLKLPFLLSGIAFVYYSWKLATAWCGIQVANLFAAFLSVSEFYVMYSQIARPYISGAFFIMAMAYYWSKMIIHQEINIKYSLGYVVFGVLSLYNHYFSLLQAGLIGLTGLFLFNRKQLIRYSVLNILIIVLFLPHLSIFFHQLGHKGLGWLGKPGNKFLIDFFNYIFHYSWIYVILLIFIIIGGLFFKTRYRDKLKTKLVLFGVGWFVISFSFGFFYSVLYQPIIQFSTLIFSFPFLILAIFSGFKRENFLIHVIQVSLLLLIGFYTLAHERKYYYLFYNESHLEILRDAVNSNKKYGEQNISVLLKNHPPIVDFYRNRIPDIDSLNAIFTYQTNKKELIKLLRKHEKPYFAYGLAKDLEYTYSKIIRDYYPYKIFQKNYYAGAFKIFSKLPSDSSRSINDTIFYSTNNFKKSLKGWNLKDSLRVFHDTLEVIEGFLMDSLIEYGPAISIPVHHAINTMNTIVTAKLTVTPITKTSINPILIVSIRDTAKNDLLIWKGINATGSITDNKTFTIYNSFRIGEIGRHENNIIECYVWNREKESFIINEITFSSWSGNPYTYAIFQPITSNVFKYYGTGKIQY